MEPDPRRIHAQVIKSATAGVSDYRFHLNNLLNLYFKSHLIPDATRLFQQIPSPNVVSWTSLISGHSTTHSALTHFVSMLRHPVCPNQRTLAILFKTCASLNSLSFGLQLHALSIKLSLCDKPFSASALIHFYSKTQLPYNARKVFDEMPERDSVCFSSVIVGLAQNGWNAMMSGYAQQGDNDSVLELFRMMEFKGLVPDEYSFLSVMTAFCNKGLVDETEHWFNKMKVEYKLEPWIEHYTCLVGAMGRAGRLEEAKNIALTMPNHKADAAMWRSLLTVSAHHGNVEMVKEMSQRLQELDPQDDSAYVIAANAFSGAGRLNEVQEVRKLMRERRVKKEGGLSWIEVCGQVHVFLAGDRRHELTEQIYAKLAELMEKILELGYVPVHNEMLHEVGKEDKIEALWYHSEKLALAFGLVTDMAPRGKALRIVKNLRICRDCHEAFKYISRVVEREIVVRDVNRYHRFLNGGCNCGDYW
ncbi:putative tetratricopeptide-like helical domain superfamily, DYW domain-containing protein [Helianthus debilis subsp. tardiflorus]